MELISLKTDEKLSLTNNGHLDLFWTGVGSMFAREHFQSNFILIKGEHHIAVDMGRNWPEAVASTARLEPMDIKTILPTHSHGDHVNSIDQWALAHRYILRDEPNPKMIIAPDYQHVLWEQTLRGGLEWNEETIDTGQRLGFGQLFDVVRPRWKTSQPRETWEIDYPENEPDPSKRIHIEMFRTNHVPEQRANWADCFISYGLFVDGHLFISGDTKFDPELVEIYADKSSVMFHDTQFFPGAVHAPLEDLKSLPAHIKSKMLLYHIADNWKDQDITGFKGWAAQGAIYRFPRQTFGVA